MPTLANFFASRFNPTVRAVLEAEEVMTAQECVRRLKVNLIVTDLVLPGRDGAAFLKWLRQQPHDTGGNHRLRQAIPADRGQRLGRLPSKARRS